MVLSLLKCHIGMVLFCMHKFRQVAQRFVTFIALLSILTQSLSPYIYVLPKVAYAQEVTPTDAPTPTDTIAPTPSDTVTPVPTDTVAPTESPTPTDVPQETVTPVPAEEPTIAPQENQENNNSPPADNNSNQSSPTVTQEPTPTKVPVQEENGDLSIVLLENTSAPSIDLDSYETQGSASLVTDKPDYAPTDTVLISGTDFNSGETYTLVITSEDEPPVHFETQVTADENGSFVYAYQLDGNYRPNYKVEAKDSSGNIAATTTFTDSPTKITAKTHQGQKSDSTYTSGNVTQYEEGDFINFRFGTEATHGPTNGQLEVRFTGDDGTCLFFDNYFNLGTIESLSGGPVPTVTILSGPTASNFGASNGEWIVTLNIDYTGTFNHPAGSARINYTLQLSDEAGQCNGSSQHSRLNPAGGTVEQSGQQNVPVPANQVIELPDITVTKNIDRDGNGSFEDTADAGEYCFSLDGGTCASIDSSGQVIFTNVTPDGVHTITETQLDFSQGTYQFVSGSGTNCTFSGASPNAAATVAAGTTPTNASCIFNNGLATGTLRVIKNVINDNGGTATAADFNLHVKSGSTDVSGSPAAGSETGTVYTLNAGTYVVSEDAPPSGYSQTGFSGDCDVSGSITLNIGDEKSCTITNTRDTGTIKVIKDVDPDDNSEWDIDISGPTPNSDTLSAGEGTSAFTSATGSYTVTETGSIGTNAEDYNSSYACVDEQDNVVASSSGTSASFDLTAEQDVTCLFTNTIKPGTVVVTKYHDRNADGIRDNGEEGLEDWTINLDDDSDTTDEDGYIEFIEIQPGGHTLGEDIDEGWFQSNIFCDNGGTYDSENGTFDLTVGPDETVNCEIGNYQLGHIRVIKDVVKPNGDPFDDQSQDVFGFSVNGGISFDLSDGQENTEDVTPGPLHTVVETPNQNYDFAGCTSDPEGGLEVENGIAVSVSSGETVTVTCTNKQKTAKIIVEKDVVKFDDSEVDDDYEFTALLNGGSGQVFSEGTSTSYDVNPGQYTVGEQDEADYEELGCKLPSGAEATDFNIGSGSEITVTCTNKQNPGTISGTKYDDDDNTLSGWTIELYSCVSEGVDCDNFITSTVTDITGFYSFTNLITGFYRVVELLQDGWTNVSDLFHDVAIQPGTESTGNNFTNRGNLSIRVCKYEDSNGPLEGGEFTSVNNWDFTLSGLTQNTGEESNCTTFSNLKPGTYQVAELPLLQGWFVADDSQGTQEVILTDENQSVDFYNYQKGSITVNKNVDINGDEDYDDEGETGATDWEWNINEGENLATGSTQTDLEPNTYLVSEVHKDGFHVVDLTCGNANYGSSENGEITVNSGEEIVCTFTNARDKGTITVDKVTNPEEDEQSFDIVARDEEDSIVHPSTLTDADDPDTYTVLSGTYSLEELPQDGWDLTDVECSKNDEESVDPSELVIDEDGDEIFCTFENTKRGKIIITKYNDLDGDGELDENEGVLEGWDINLTDGNQYDQTKTTDEIEGDVEFNNLILGSYLLSEILKPGWEQTNIFCDRESFSEGEVRVGAGQTVNCSILNKSTTPILTITKENNTGGATLTPGSEVLYTITVSLSKEGGVAEDVKVTDLLPDGFKYKGGSWTASSNVNPGLVVPEPVYASPGLWSLGNMAAGEKITLTLIATISNDQQLGLYKDVAWAQGKSLAEDSVLAIANDPGDLDPGESNFVGTQVNVDKTTTESVGLTVRRGEVLGASTEELPATGAKTLWTLSAVAVLLAGLNLMVIGFIIRRRYV